jgi:Ca-activated chloride channel homolog
MKTSKTELKLELSLDRNLAWSRGGSVRYLRARLVAGAEENLEAKRRPPQNLGIVLDRSGSMGGKPLDLAKRAVEKVLDLLDEQDRFSLVLFNDCPTTLYSGVSVGPHRRKEIQAVLAECQAHSGTNLSGGWLEGARCVAEVMDAQPGLMNHVILLTDGEANIGDVDPESLGRHASELRRRNLTSSAVGIGEGYSQTQLKPIATQGGGRLHDAQFPHEIVEVIEGEMGGILRSAAEQVELSLLLPDSIEVKCLSAYPMQRSEEGCHCALGSLEFGRDKDVIFQLTLPAGSNGDVHALGVQAEWRKPGHKGLRQTEGSVTIALATGTDNTSQVRDQEVAERVLAVWHADLVLRATELNREGSYEEAKVLLKTAMDPFRRYAKGLAKGEEYLANLQRMLKSIHQEWGERGRKELTLFSINVAYSLPDRRLQSRGGASELLAQAFANKDQD